VRFLGAVMIFLSLSFLGVARGMKLREEVERICEIRRLISFLASFLQNGSPETRALFAALQKEGSFRHLPFIKKLAFSPCRPPEEVWEEALKSTPLSPEEYQFLSPVGKTLGRYDAVTQQRQLEQLLLSMPPIIEKREEKLRVEGKLSHCSGVLLGLLAVILLA